MSTHATIVADTHAIVPNGSGAAAILAAGIGSLVVAVSGIAADKSPSLKSLFSIHKPTGALSGETTLAILVWLVAWAILEVLWRKRNVPLLRINVIALVLLGLSLLSTFPPIGDLF